MSSVALHHYDFLQRFYDGETAKLYELSEIIRVPNESSVGKRLSYGHVAAFLMGEHLLDVVGMAMAG